MAEHTARVVLRRHLSYDVNKVILALGKSQNSRPREIFKHRADPPEVVFYAFVNIASMNFQLL